MLEKFLHIDIERYIELMRIDIQQEHKIQNKKEIRVMEHKNSMTFNISGGQVNIARDNASINAVQNNEVCERELDIIIKGIMDNLWGLKEEDAETIVDAVDMAKVELNKTEPKISRLRSCATLMAPMITIVNGIPTLADNLQRFVEYIETYIH